MIKSKEHPGIIRRLPEAVANQIAAGEVVQRPASAVKELIENAIDAGADRIQLFVRDAGKTLLQVIDNGSGMLEEDAIISFQRHATSKIRKAEDLFAIRSMGFRGEALASIAAIAQVELKTRRYEDELGALIRVEGSEIVHREPTAASPGTSISVKNLFYNIPARRNFLKSNPVEMRHIVDEFHRCALAHPEIHFSFHSEGNEIYHLPSGTLKQRIVHLFGKNYNERLVPITEDTTIIRLRGFIGKPNYAKRTRGEQFFFVNKRFIKDSYLHHAIMNAYAEVLQPDTFPLYVLFIDIDPGKIDINVHPTKTEIKYEDERAIYAIVRSAVRRSLGHFHITPSIDFDQETGLSHLMESQADKGEIKAPQIAFNPEFNPFSADNDKAEGRSRNERQENWDTLYKITQSVESRQLDLTHESTNFEESLTEPEQEPEKNISNRLFQLHRKYIISQVHSGFLLIDQQAAHERILYEHFLSLLESRRGSSQRSLFPQTLHFNGGDAALVEELLPEIEALGFQLSYLGKNTYVVEGIPADLHKALNEKEVFEQLLEDFKNNKAQLKLSTRDNLARSLAKSAAIKEGTALEPSEMAELIDKLFACQSANMSIYGRPVILTFTMKELLSRFEKQ